MNAEMWITKEVKFEVKLDRVRHVSFFIISGEHDYTIVHGLLWK